MCTARGQQSCSDGDTQVSEHKLGRRPPSVLTSFLLVVTSPMLTVTSLPGYSLYTQKASHPSGQRGLALFVIRLFISGGFFFF